MDIEALDLSELTDDGDTLKLDDGRMLRFEIAPGEASFDDIAEHSDIYGHTAWTTGDGDYAPARHVRPDGFTSAAEILARDGNSALWWEPFDLGNIPGGREGEAFRAYRQNIRDILEYGFFGYILELCDGVDAYGRPVVVDVASIWGVKPFADPAYVATLVSDLASELG